MASKNLDPRLELPPIAGLEYDDKEIEYRIPHDPDISFTMPPISVGLLPPSNVQIIEQRIRRGQGGKDVVDLIIEVEDMPGATEYEVRVTPR